jgi:simple sugar transport system ATP-binding protein
VEGNGQRVVADLLSGLRRPSSGEILVDGVEVDVSQAGAALRAGIAVIPEDRHDSGIVLEMSVAENLILSNQSGMSTRGIIDGVALAAAASDMIDRFSIMCTGPAAPMWTLSGGNQQRVVLAREITADPTVLVAAQPTRGLDVGAIEYMTDQLRQVAGSGVGILLISSELDEILEMADRIVVIFGGQLTGEMVRSEATREKIGRLMGGDLL